MLMRDKKRATMSGELSKPADSAKAAGVQMLVLSHIVPPISGRFLYPAFLGDAAKHFSGPIVIGEDGMLFGLPAGNKAITQSQLF